MKLEIDVRSALLGAGALALVGFATSWQSASGVTPVSRVEKPPLRVAGIPDPRDILEIRGEPESYVVPAGKRFVLTALGQVGCGIGGGVSISVDGQADTSFNASIPDTGEANVVAIPHPTVIFNAGENLVVYGAGCGNDKKRAWGYLIDA